MGGGARRERGASQQPQARLGGAIIVAFCMRKTIRPCNACGLPLEVTNYKRAICVPNTCALYVTAKNYQKVTTTIYAHVQSAKRASIRSRGQRLRLRQSFGRRRRLV